MKIGFLTERMLLGYGVDLVVHEQAQRLTQLGHEVTVYAARADRSVERPYALKVIAEAFPGFHDLTSPDRIRAFFADPDIARFDVWSLHTPPFYAWIRYIERPVVLVEYGQPGGQFFNQATAYMLWRHFGSHLADTLGFLRRGDGVMAISHAIARTLPARVQPYTRVIHLGADHYGRSNAAEAGAFRRAHGLSETDFVVLWVGRMQFRADEQPYKGFPELLRLIPRLRAISPRVKVVCLGKIDHDEMARFDEIDAVLVPNIPASRIGAAYAAADVLINLSQWEGFNLALVESQFQGTPVVALDGGPHPEVVAKDRSGLLVNSSDELVEGVRRLFRKPAQLAEFSRRARQFAEPMTWRASVDQFAALIAKCAAEHAAAPLPARDFDADQKFPAIPIPPIRVPRVAPEPVFEPVSPALVEELLDLDPADLVAQAYVRLLGRPADPAGMAHYQQRISQGRPALAILREMAQSQEFANRHGTIPPILARKPGLRGRVQQMLTGSRPSRKIGTVLALEDVAFVQAAYRAVLNREPDPEGFAHYVQRIRETGEKHKIVLDLARSGEFRRQPHVPLRLRLALKLLPLRKTGGGSAVPSLLLLDDAAFVEAAYTTILRRAPDPSGLDHYLSWLRTTGEKRAILLDILSSDEAQQHGNGRLERALRLPQGGVQERRPAGGTWRMYKTLDNRLSQIETRLVRLPVAPEPLRPVPAAPARRPAGTVPASTADHVCLHAPQVTPDAAGERRLVEAAQASGADIVFGDEILHGPDGQSRVLARTAFGPHGFACERDLGGVVAVRRELLATCGLSPGLALTGDILLQILAKAHTVGHLPCVVGHRDCAERIANRPSASAWAAYAAAASPPSAPASTRALVLVVHADGAVAPGPLVKPGGIVTDVLVRPVCRAGGMAAINRAVADAPPGLDLVVLVDATLRAVTVDWLVQLAGLALESDVGMASPLVLTADGRLVDKGWQIGPAGQCFPRDRFASHSAGQTDLTNVPGQFAGAREAAALGMNCVAFRRTLFREIGGFDEKLDGTVAGLDLCLRLRDLGFAMVLDDSIVMTGLPAHLPHGLDDDLTVAAFRAGHQAALEQHDPFVPALYDSGNGFDPVAPVGIRIVSLAQYAG